MNGQGSSNLYIIADKENSPYQSYPSTTKTEYYNDSTALAVCFKHKSIVTSINHFCFHLDLNTKNLIFYIRTTF